MVELTYKRHLNIGEHARALVAVLDALARVDPRPLILRSKILGLKLQDHKPRYQDRVANRASFKHELRAAPDLASLLDWAEAT